MIVNASVFCFVCFLMCVLKLCVAAIFMFILWLTNWPMTRQGEDSFHQCCVDRCFKCVVTSLSACILRLMLLMWYNRGTGKFSLMSWEILTNHELKWVLQETSFHPTTRSDLPSADLNEVIVRLDFILRLAPVHLISLGSYSRSCDDPSLNNCI